MLIIMEAISLCILLRKLLIQSKTSYDYFNSNCYFYMCATEVILGCGSTKTLQGRYNKNLLCLKYMPKHAAHM